MEKGGEAPRQISIYPPSTKSTHTHPHTTGQKSVGSRVFGLSTMTTERPSTPVLCLASIGVRLQSRQNFGGGPVGRWTLPRLGQVSFYSCPSQAGSPFSSDSGGFHSVEGNTRNGPFGVLTPYAIGLSIMQKTRLQRAMLSVVIV